MRSIVDQIADPVAGTVRGVGFHVLREPLLLAARLGVRLQLEGIRNVPDTGGLLVVANHLHNADPLLMAIAFPRPLHFMAKEELFRIPVIGRLLARFGAFPVSRGKSDRKAIRRAIATMEHGVATGMYPEGTRSKTMRLSRGHPGVGLVAIQGKRPILPLAVTGSERLPFNGKRSAGRKPDPGHRGVKLRFGQPFSLPSTAPDGKPMNAEAATEVIMRSIAALLPEDYRGAYDSSSKPENPSIDSPSAASAASVN